MDANGLRFWMLANIDQWQVDGDPAELQYDRQRRSLRLTSRHTRPVFASDPLKADARLDCVPQTRDARGTRAYWDDEKSAVMATGALATATPILKPPIAGSPTSLAMGYDDILYLAIGGQVVLHDLRDRWRPTVVSCPNFAAWRLAPDPAGGVWALDPGSRQLARLRGAPLPERGHRPYAAGTARPCAENPMPPQLQVWEDALLSATDRPLTIACSPEGRLALLCQEDSEKIVVRLLSAHGHWQKPIYLAHYASSVQGEVHLTRAPYSMAWVAPDRIAVLLVSLPGEALVYPLPTDIASDEGSQILPVGDFYPLLNHNGNPLVNGIGYPVQYLTANDADAAEERPSTGIAPLHHLSRPSYARVGFARNSDGTVLDSGNSQTEWHRLYIEADIPPGCAIGVFLQANEKSEPPAIDPAALATSPEWFEHRFGRVQTTANGAAPPLPQGAWVSLPSEIPFHDGLTACQRRPDRSGLFTALIQRNGRRVSTLRGRYLHVLVQLLGDGRASPELWALRAYASRFSYRDHYLPALYRETLVGADADAPIQPSQRTSGADFLERFLDNFEGILTPLEDRIAHSYLLTDPRTTPAEALAWLGSWIGVTFQAAVPEAQRRRLLQQAPALFRRRGTLAGLCLALDIATDGGVTRGELVVVEDWRLRRTLATVLGVNLAHVDDPLLGGLAVSGNSFVGDTLILTEADRQEELKAVFVPHTVRSQADEATLRHFLDELAFRVTVLVHQETRQPDLELIERVVELEKPAHIAVRVVAASEPFRIGMAALVGVHTYLNPSQRPASVAVEGSRIGVRDRLYGPGTLDPRVDSGGHSPIDEDAMPIADAGLDQIVLRNRPFTLDGSASQAAPGHSIVSYRWRGRRVL